MKQRQFRSMGTTVTVVAESESEFAATERWFETVEQICSRFRPDSELSHVNAIDTPTVALSPILAAVVKVAHDARMRTDGLVDIAIGKAVRSWGYDRTFVEVADLEQPPSPASIPKWMVTGQTLKREPGVELDLGGIAKGWACDIAVERGMAAIVSAGGDVRSNHPDAIVPIADPWGDIVIEYPLGLGALATSSVTRRRWQVGRQEAHHLIDPRTGSPSESPILSASAIAASAAEAEAGAKAVLLLGAEGLAWADRCQWISGAVVVWNDGSVYGTSGMKNVA